MQTPDSSCCPPPAGMLSGRAGAGRGGPGGPGRGGPGRAGAGRAGTASGGSCWYSPTRAGGGHVTRAPDTSHPHCSLSSGHTCPACRRGHLGRGHSLVLLLSGLGIDCTGCARLLQSVFTTGSPQLLAAPARVTRAPHGACAGPGPASSIGPYRQISVAIICTWDREAAALIMLRGEGCGGL